jgi:hypothetical protein
MNEERFWAIIEESRRGIRGWRDSEKQYDRLLGMLQGEAPEAIIEFNRILTAKMAESYRWDLWGIGYIVNGGCSDDGFEYFRCWIISLGKEFYEKALEDPESIAEVTNRKYHYEFEPLLHVAFEAYEVITETEMPVLSDLPSYPSDPIGEPWSEEDLPLYFPKACKKYKIKRKRGPISRTIDREHVEAITANLKDDNGVKYYLEAWLDFSNSAEYRHHGAVRGLGMYGEYDLEHTQYSIPQLEELVQNNAHAYDLIREASTKEYFAYPSDHRINYWYMDIFAELNNFMLARSVVFGERQAYGEAVETDFELLHFAGSILKDRTPRKSLDSSRCFGTGGVFHTEGIALLQLRHYSKKLEDLDYCQTLIKDLLELKKGRASTREYMEKEITSQGLLQDFGSLEDDPTGKQFWGKIQASTQAQLDSADKSFPEIAREINFGKDSPFKMITQGTLIYVITRAEADIRATIIVAALRAHFLEGGTYPEELEGLSSIVPQHILIDPFSEKTFRYKNKKDDYLLYSIGPDMIDSGGKRIDPHSAGTDGDIVY